MEQQTQPQEAYKPNWFDRHKSLTCFAILALFFLGFAPFHRIHQTVVQGVATPVLPTATATPTPTDTPTPTFTPTATPTLTPTPTAFIAPTQQRIPTTQQPATQEQGLSNDNHYINSSGNDVHSPAYSTDGSVPAGASAKCADGTYSFSQHRSGTCSHHGGVVQWL
jgi:Protein of unknown function (DUF3761)